MKCKHCNIEHPGPVGLFANHVRWCEKNPKAAAFRAANVQRGQELGDKRFGELKPFQVVCAACNDVFEVEEREHLFPSKAEYFCSRSCANSTGGKAKALKYHGDDVAGYVTVAWRHHERKCVVCGEHRVVAVHHLNENHNDNDPKNLVPLCPTHHHYMHSRHKELINQQVLDYVEHRWK